jgi:hypothetical protein
MYVGVPETAETLTGEKPASLVRELPPPQQTAVNNGEMNVASANPAPDPARHQRTANTTVLEAEREDAPSTHSPQVGVETGDRRGKQT